jgi:hypothetical protein
MRINFYDICIYFWVINNNVIITPINTRFARLGQVRNFPPACLPSVGKGKVISKGGCPAWAWANSFSGEVAHRGQRRICFTSYLPTMGKHESKKMAFAQVGQRQKKPAEHLSRRSSAGFIY